MGQDHILALASLTDGDRFKKNSNRRDGLRGLYQRYNALPDSCTAAIAMPD
jgi:hypothetical protein